jgi:hypothetical protein
MRTLLAALGTLIIAAFAFLFGTVTGFVLARVLDLHAPGEVAGIGGIFNGLSSGIFYGLICGLISGILGAIGAIRLFKNP